MACASPLTAYRCSDGSLTFSERPGRDVVAPMSLACGQCALCRTARAGELCTRLVQEAHSHDATCVPTLTYSDERLPPGGSVSKRHCQLFLKRVRFEAASRGAPRVRFNLISEYSPELLRAHYHAILFGYWPSDAVRFNKSRAGRQQYTSDVLTRLWGHGHVTFQEFSPEAALYIAKHDSWKLTGARAADECLPVFDASGAIVGHREPEFRLCSRRPGMGASFFDRYARQLLANDFTVVGGSRVPLPDYYLRRGSAFDPGRVSELRAEHELALRSRADDFTPGRLAAREACALAAIRRGVRDGVE